MMILVRILEKWCQDYRMSISVTKTKVVSPNPKLLWQIYNSESGKQETVERIIQFKYLGLLQKHGVEATVLCNAVGKLEKAEHYQKNILRVRRLIPDKVDVYLAMWKNVALPSILYGLEALPFSSIEEEKIEKVQISLGKSILGIRQSTAGPVVYTELGLKPISMLITERKIRYVSQVLHPDYQGSEIVKFLMGQHMREKCSLFYKDMATRLNDIHVKPEDIDASTLKRYQDSVIAGIILKIDSYTSLKALPIPPQNRWFKKQPYISEEPWSQVIAEFRGGNARIGNRDDSLGGLVVTNEQGRAVSCPLCLQGPNNEVHLLIDCKKMIAERRRHSLPN